MPTIELVNIKIIDQARNQVGTADQGSIIGERGDFQTLFVHAPTLTKALQNGRQYSFLAEEEGTDQFVPGLSFYYHQSASEPKQYMFTKDR